MKRLLSILFNLILLIVDIIFVFGFIGLIIMLYYKGLKDGRDIIGIVFAVAMVIIGLRLAITNILDIIKGE